MASAEQAGIGEQGSAFASNGIGSGESADALPDPPLVGKPVFMLKVSHSQKPLRSRQTVLVVIRGRGKSPKGGEQALWYGMMLISMVMKTAGELEVDRGSSGEPRH